MTTTIGETSKACKHCGKMFHYNGGPRNSIYEKWLLRKYCGRDCADAMRKFVKPVEPDPTEDEIRQRAKWIRDNEWGKGQSGDRATPAGYVFPDRIDWRDRE
jgi:hypothetical protein